MTLRKATNDNSVNDIPQIELTKERDIKPNTFKDNSLLKKQKKNTSQVSKKFIKDYITEEGFRILK